MDFETLEDLTCDLSPLEQAEIVLRAGYPLPVDLATTLIAQGHVLSDLEARYST